MTNILNYLKMSMEKVGYCPPLRFRAFHRERTFEVQEDSVSRSRAILCHAKNTKEVYYQFTDQGEAAAVESPPEAVATPAPAAVPVTVPAAPVSACPLGLKMFP
ncbi:hypothetical protein SCP_1502140 [Sparassis crispa]|uniref:Uncharacterized protein n=1 Tax=Sparassis crispa TaxID=139825 RepID=A0A401H437_9APHY|nr:hypothetical protein SCP_1501990 [Sparassis crispa]XP_027620119.1 hypothetical protein SCP_1502140 [Sparassis crispa]GBE89191.1 hypothetical protein SCP_1501990 [Sparassis crispa]GBE89206.1 hypothetical protein SCP_1502140 [Sparassis crispa]